MNICMFHMNDKEMRTKKKEKCTSINFRFIRKLCKLELIVCCKQCESLKCAFLVVLCLWGHVCESGLKGRSEGSGVLCRLL